MEENYQEELNKIKKTVQNYVDAVKEFNFEQAEKSWHPKGVKIFYNESKDNLDMITLLQSKPYGKPLGEISQEADIKEINRVGQAATVLLQWNQERNRSKTVITDFILLLHIKNQWKIVAKVYDVKKLDD